MNKMRKKLSMVVLGVVLVMALSVTAFASSAWDSFSTKLPANQGLALSHGLLIVLTTSTFRSTASAMDTQLSVRGQRVLGAETTPILIGNSALEATGMFITIPIIFRLKEPTSR